MKWPKIHRFGEAALLVEWQPQIHEKTHYYVMSLVQFLQTQVHLNIIDITPTYHSVAIYFSEISNISTIKNIINQYCDEKIKNFNIISTRIIEIPVCYDKNFGLDIEEMSQNLNISIPQIIEKHTAPLYKVFFLGFLPGFPYLGGLESDLYFNRKSTPRPNVIAGSVAIGGEQTGIYSMNSPGGWNIIGKTPLLLFDVNAIKPTLLRAGDCVKFKAITLDEYSYIEHQVFTGVYKTVVLND